MENLQNNQILITISKDKKKLTVETGLGHSITVDSCPNRTIDNIENAIKALDEKYEFTKSMPEWQPKGCGYLGTGKCIDCN